MLRLLVPILHAVSATPPKRFRAGFELVVLVDLLPLLARLLGGRAAGLRPPDEVGGARRVPPDGPAEASRLLGSAGDAAVVDRRACEAWLAQVEGHAADGRRPEVRVPLVNGRESAEELVAWLPPLRDEGLVAELLPQEPVVQLAGDRLLLVVQLVDVARALVVDLRDPPCGLVAALTLVGLVHCILHLLVELLQLRLDVIPALGRLLRVEGPYPRHRCAPPGRLCNPDVGRCRRRQLRARS
mmetsp:Transcript_3665/g.10592  ORF Transcript_3665/g.10592 Transcript_3665/m.10592 type:complete len:242 (-) Transcript_3665:12-737(-)